MVSLIENAKNLKKLFKINGLFLIKKLISLIVRLRTKRGSTVCYLRLSWHKIILFILSLQNLRKVWWFQVQCCGANGSEDYNDALKPMPVECRDPVKGGEYPYGCAQQFAWWLEPWTCVLAGVCFSFILIHIGQIVFSSKIMKTTKKYDRAYTYENWFSKINAEHKENINDSL